MSKKLIFLIHESNIYSTYWQVVEAFEDEKEANTVADQLRAKDTDCKFKVTQLPFTPKHK